MGAAKVCKINFGTLTSNWVSESKMMKIHIPTVSNFVIFVRLHQVRQPPAPGSGPHGVKCCVAL